MERKTGFEPATPTLARLCSTTELLSQFMVPEAGLEPARTEVRGILSPLCLPIPPLRQTFFFGGDTQIRTGDKDFADPCLTTWRCRQKNLAILHQSSLAVHSINGATFIIMIFVSNNFW